MNSPAIAQKICLALCFVSTLSLAVPGQVVSAAMPAKETNRKPATLRTLVATEVQLLVKVRDSFGEAVTGLQAADFAVFDNGRRQVNVECQPYRAPLQLILLIDESCHWTERTAQLNLELQTFCRSLSAEDQIAVIQFADSFALTHDWTAPKAIPAALFQPPRLRPKRAALFDALLFALTRFSDSIADAKTQRTIVLFTNGSNATGLAEVTDVLAALQEEEVALYLYNNSAPAKSAALRAETNDALASLAKLSGGRSYAPRGETGLRAMFESLSRELQTQYALTFLPALAQTKAEEEGELSHEFLVNVRGGHQAVPRVGYTKTKLLPDGPIR
jgi:VWFA-related protein